MVTKCISRISNSQPQNVWKLLFKRLKRLIFLFKRLNKNSNARKERSVQTKKRSNETDVFVTGFWSPKDGTPNCFDGYTAGKRSAIIWEWLCLPLHWQQGNGRHRSCSFDLVGGNPVQASRSYFGRFVRIKTSQDLSVSKLSLRRGPPVRVRAQVFEAAWPAGCQPGPCLALLSSWTDRVQLRQPEKE